MVQPHARRIVDVRVLYTEGCVATPATVDLVTSVARELDIRIRLQQILVASPEQAAALKFLGSPTVHVNGLDVDPAARQHTHFGFMGRHYGASGTPPRDMIVEALSEAVGPSTPH